MGEVLLVGAVLVLLVVAVWAVRVHVMERRRGAERRVAHVESRRSRR